MKIVLATGIYPPDIGGPATYVQALARHLAKRGVDVTVITYGEERKMREDFAVIATPLFGGPLMRWWQYAQVLRAHARTADVVVAFSSVSVGMPLLIARLRRPKTILRLGGDFLWERYTDRGGMRTLWEFHKHPTFLWRIGHLFMQMLLRSFDAIVFSTKFQEEIYEWHYGRLPPHSVLENASDVSDVSTEPRAGTLHAPVRLLFMGRFVAFKNLSSLIEAMQHLPDAQLTLVGDGPLAAALRAKVEALALASRVRFLPPARGAEKDRIFREHDLFVLPSLTEISPNVALEAQAAGLPVLLTSETGLSESMRGGMILRHMHSPEDITAAVRTVLAASPATAPRQSHRDWEAVTAEWMDRCTSVLA